MEVHGSKYRDQEEIQNGARGLGHDWMELINVPPRASRVLALVLLTFCIAGSGSHNDM